jgi:DNA invertase Pin-like site-specific DNA recombinase
MDEPKARDAAGTPIPAVIYAAKSTEDKHGSIASQLADCRKMAAENSWRVVGEYEDEGFSAYSRSRGPGLAEAREHAARAAAEFGTTVMLVAQHSDRLSRGAGDKPGAAEALIEIWHAERRREVHLRSVQDDFDLRTSASVANMGERNYSDSRRKALATAAGRRRSAERGEWCGAAPDGYEIEHTGHGNAAVRRVVMHPERREVYRLLWDMAIDGATVNSIVRELAGRGYRTAPRRARPRPFDATRVGNVLVNPFYAGLMVYQREIIGDGNWSAYVEPADWHRLRQERSERARHRQNPVGRPPKGLLARLARCKCGGALIEQRNGARKDGSRRRVYTCRAHMHGAGACSARPYDAEQVERMVLGGLDDLLCDAGAWADALLAGRKADRARLSVLVADAEREMEECEQAVEQLVGEYDAAVVAGDKAGVDLSKKAWEQRRRTVERAALRQQAAADALASVAEEPEDDAEHALARMWEALSGELDAVRTETAALNAVLQEWFDSFVLERTEDGRIRVVPVLRYEATLKIVRRRLLRQMQHVRERGFTRPLPVEGWETFSRLEAALSQPDKQSQSRLPHNNQRGSSRGTAGGTPRRSRTAQPRRSQS